MRNYVEPFAGSLAVLLARETEPKIETVNDLDCWIANFWRSLQHDPESVAQHADWPVNETDLHARHLWLVKQADFRERMKTDPDFYDAKVAGWWVWGISQWIGSGWCAGAVSRSRPYVSSGKSEGQGVHRKIPMIANGPRGTANDVGVESLGGLYQWMFHLSDRLRRVRVCCGDWKRILGPAPTTCIGTTAVFLDGNYIHEYSERY